MYQGVLDFSAEVPLEPSLWMSSHRGIHVAILRLQWSTSPRPAKWGVLIRSLFDEWLNITLHCPLFLPGDYCISSSQ